MSRSGALRFKGGRPPRGTAPGVKRRCPTKHCAIALFLAVSCANAGPPGDEGDAPVGNNGQGILAYPGVLARWDPRFNNTSTVFSPQYPQGAWLNPGYTGFLGALAPAVRADSAMDPALPENDCRPVLLFDGPAPRTRAPTRSRSSKRP